MASAQLGNRLGIAAVGNNGFLSNITADGANTVTVDDTLDIDVGRNIDLVNKNTGAVLASNRQVQSLTSAGVLTYSGADVAAVPGTTIVVATGTTVQTGYSNLNGGSAPGDGFSLGGEATSIDRLRNRLNTLLPTTYPNSELDKMTENDMIYALRQIEAPGSLK
jgi:hypothetical protein